MATRSTMGYMDSKGEFRGTYIHWDGYGVGEEASKTLVEEGYHHLVTMVEEGIANGGRSTFDECKPYGDGRQPWLITSGKYFQDPSLEYAWVVLPKRVIPLETYLYEQRVLSAAKYGY